METDFAEEGCERAGEREGVVEEDRSVERGVEGPCWGYFVVGDAVGHGLLMGVGQVAGG